jgi:GNAT superfamily N-acetyltransferase
MIIMIVTTTDKWDEALWLKAEPIYNQSFHPEGRKTISVIRQIFDRKIGYLHVAIDGSQAVAMAITGKLDNANALLIDYLAVREDLRSRSIGEHFMQVIKNWAQHDKQLDGIIIEIESDRTPINQQRLRFWQKCGFTLTDYIHQYIWVPEPYHALYLRLRPTDALPADGKSLFRLISQ